MPRDRQSRRPDRTTRQAFSPGSTSSDAWLMHHMELAERVTSVEATTDCLTEHHHAMLQRMQDGERRFSHGRDRMDELDDRLRDTTRELGRHMLIPDRVSDLERTVSPLPSLVNDLKDRHEAFVVSFTKLKSTALYGAALMLLSLVLSGRMMLDQLAKVIVAIAKVAG